MEILGEEFDFVEAFLWILGINAVGLISGFVSGTASGTFYQSLSKPFFTPPSWVFGVVWPVLYTLIGISGYLAWRSDISNRIKLLFIGQILLNFFWSIIFFGYESITLALVEIFVLVAVLVPVVKGFYEEKKVSAYLLVPYVIWVVYALVLNLSIVLLN